MAARLYARPQSALGATLFLLFLFLALAGPLLAPYGANQQLAAEARKPPSLRHPFGSDALGRDVFSRVLLGAREVLLLAGSGTLLAVFSGLCLGLLTGYQGGWLDEVIMRLFDSLLALPALLLALLFLGALGSGNANILLVIMVVYTPIVARLVRSVALATRTLPFVEVARMQGVSLARILFSEILPSVLPALAVEVAFRFSYAIFLVASLGFLGVGVQPPSPNWGLMVKEARVTVNQAPWALYFPAAAISLVVIGANLLADGLKRVLAGEQ
jgi:peptide/nickel transport system permease protein